MLKIMGKSQASIEQMRAYIKKVNPQVPDSVIKMIPLYITEGAAEYIRGDVAFAQSCLETGNFTFAGSAVTLDQNNFCGMGVTKTGTKGNSFKTPAEGIRAQIQHLQAYACTDRLKQKCVDTRYTYVNRGCAEYVEYLGIQENPKGQGWASGRNYGQKIINILNSILSIKTEKEKETMNINTSFISNNNSYAGQTPAYIVIHNTDNYAKGANAKAHAKAQHDGNFKGYSAHVFVDDVEAYQALPYNRGAWHVGVNYGGRLFGTVNNRNSVGIEMCVQAGYNYEKAFQNTVQVCKQLMKQLGIPADRVVQHYDVCAKNCPSAIRAKGDWNRFKQLIGTKTTTTTVDKYYRTRKSWADSKSQIGAYKSLENAKKEWKEGYTIYDWNGKAVYPVKKTSTATLTEEIKVQLPVIRKGSSGAAVSSLQAVLGVEVDGSFGNDTETSLKVFQKNVGITADGSCGTDTWKKVVEHMKANTDN
jgi:N-acetylmuramoyl-L-alanine amidase CwlA